uniref:Putative reverse transcriptase, RNA-dependent DNA polymerase, Gag-polypeptide of LTR copia-type n=1 Tax=Tanacetum cinerariifolium TaxID=118510 RepID=A0A6L2PBZ2_TANCI|nr:putative reverse transcriptase, RNA-dependent DNA polymerase, Gag-polypeptide of LTR copia-type [Tanacetum cinerariifolium]
MEEKIVVTPAVPNYKMLKEPTKFAPPKQTVQGSLSQDVYLGHAFSDNDRDELTDHSKLMKLMQFLMGLDDIYQPIRSSHLTKDIPPALKDAFVIVYRYINNGNGNKGNYNSLLCKNCGLKGHTIERCFEIIGYPPGFKRNPNLKPTINFNNNMNNKADTRGNFMSNNEIKTSTGTLSFTNASVLKFMSLLNNESGSSAHANIAETIAKAPSSCPNDDEEGPSGKDGNVHQPMSDYNNIGYDDQHIATPIVEENLSKGNVGTHLESIEPSSFEEASKDINWINAMNEEMQALYENDTSVLSDLSDGKKPIGSKWVFRVKSKSNGVIERYKARLVAKGFGQI